jgi:hypothetical protein
MIAMIISGYILITIMTCIILTYKGRPANKYDHVANGTVALFWPLAAVCIVPFLIAVFCDFLVCKYYIDK